MKLKFALIIPRRRWRKKIKKIQEKKRYINKFIFRKYSLKKKFLIKLKVIELSYKPPKLIKSSNNNLLSKKVRSMVVLKAFRANKTSNINLKDNFKFNNFF